MRDLDDGQITRVEAIVYSMTPGERSNPSLIGGSRRRAHSQGKRHDPPGCEPAAQPVQTDPEAHEADELRQGHGGHREDVPLTARRAHLPREAAAQ